MTSRRRSPSVLTDTVAAPETAGEGIRARRTFLGALVAILMLQTAWWCVTPLFRGPDEVSHAYRMSSVMLGQWRPDYEAAERGGQIATKVEPDIVEGAETVCRELYAEFRPEACDPVTRYDDGTLGMGSSADRYNPLYYALVGPPSLAFEGNVSIWVMRGTSALLCALLMAWGWTLLLSSARTPWPAAAFIVVTTPAVFFGTSVVAPNGLTFASAMLLWAGLLSAIRERAPARSAILTSTIGGTLLALSHTTGPMWLATILCSHLAFAGWRVYAAVLRANLRSWLLGAGLVVLATLAAVAWTLSASANDPSAGGEPLVDEVKDIPIAAHVLLWLFQTIGVLPNRFGILWLQMYPLWLMVLLAFIVYGLKRGTRRSRAGMLTALALSVAIPTVLTVLTYDQLGVAWQGRYGLPLLFGVILIAGEGLDRNGVGLPARLFVLATFILTVAQLLALLCLGLREQSGPYDDGRPWTLLLFVVVPLLVAGAYALLARLGIRSAAARREFGSFS